LLSNKVQAWQQALLIVQPETLLRWHRDLFRWVWRRKSKATNCKPKQPLEPIALILRLVNENWLWGAERIRGELLKLGIRVSKRTIQRYMRRVGQPRARGQSWATFLHNHAQAIWACDFVQAYDLCFRAIFVFVMIEHHSRRVIHVGVTLRFDGGLALIQVGLLQKMLDSLLDIRTTGQIQDQDPMHSDGRHVVPP
jgi:putative transposase